MQSIRPVEALESNHLHDIPYVFGNPGGLPDGAVVYGIVLNRRKPAIGGWNAV